MRPYVEFGWLEVITTQQTMQTLYHKKRNPNNIQENQIPRFTSKRHMLAYQAFADACKYHELYDIDYLKIKKIVAYVNNGIWKFKYKIKTGWIFSDYCELEYDEDWEAKQKEQDKKDRENEKRRRRLGRR